jgi:[ribosomal protein S5]-alanine N-acetyltransferase
VNEPKEISNQAGIILMKTRTLPKLPKTFATEGMELVRPTIKHLPAVRQMLVNPNIMKYVTIGARSESQADEEYIGSIEAWNKDGFGTYLAFDPRQQKLMGFAKLYVNARSPFVQLGYALDEPYWNQGWGTKLGKICLELGFNQLNQPRLDAFARIENKASRHILEKLGMHLETDSFRYDNRPYAHYSMEAVEYFGLYQLRSSVPNSDRVKMLPQP